MNSRSVVQHLCVSQEAPVVTPLFFGIIQYKWIPDTVHCGVVPQLLFKALKKKRSNENDQIHQILIYQ